MMKPERGSPEGGTPMQIGGQAVLEGVMMRGPAAIATAVRRPDGTIALRKEPFVSLVARSPLLKAPLLRGAVGLVEMLVIGIRALNFSADVALEAEKGPRESAVRDAEPGARSSLAVGTTVFVALGLGILLFFVLPLAGASSLLPPDENPFLYNMLAGGFRLVIFLAYLAGIAMMRDVRRLFAYHGAEHKAVFAYEQGKPLDVPSAIPASRFHPRCGTSFLLIVMLSAVVLFALLDGLLMLWIRELNIGIRLLTHLPLIPLVGGVSYELIRLSSRHAAAGWAQAVIAPGLWLQRITTREPDAGQLEVALVALRAALDSEAQRESASMVLGTSGGVVANA